jgi:UDPglucose 6-dehydrogenase
MRVGVCGLGRLGLPLAVAIEQKGHTVYGYDIRPEAASKTLLTREALEDGTGDYAAVVAESGLRFASTVDELVRECDLIFVTVQTPNREGYTGTSKVWGQPRRDYDYSYLERAAADLSAAVEANGKDRVIALVCTVLPGTCRRLIKPLLGPHSKLAYNPFTVAMGTVVRDFYNQEFYIMGLDDLWAHEMVMRFYETIGPAPLHVTSLENAELIKVLYNTFITTKICFANTVMELCHKVPGADCDDVMSALKKGTQRLISPSYLNGGMVDAGPCHPKDLRSVGWLSGHVGLSFDLFDTLLLSVERQCDWLASLIQSEHEGLAVVLLGKAFKENTNQDTGSAVYLLRQCLEDRGVMVSHHIDPLIDDPAVELPVAEPACYVVGTKHACFYDLEFPAGSVVVDVFRFLPPKPGVRYVRVGVGPSPD